MDKFKKFLLENKSRLEPEEPPVDAWASIVRRVSKTKKKTAIVRLLKWSAAACIIALAGIGLYTLIKTGDKPATKRTIITKTTGNPIIDSPTRTMPENKIDTVIEVTPQPAKKIRKSTKPGTTPVREFSSGITSTNLPDQSLSSFIAAIENQKTIISSTPVFGVDQDHFKEFVGQYKTLEATEQKLKDRIKTSGVNSEILDEMIKTLKMRIDILIRLKAEIDKVNEINRNKRTDKTYVKII